MRRILIAALAFTLLGGCARSSFAGISFAPGAADPELQRLARSAASGNKSALLELGIRYEEGRGVPIDLPRATRLYGQAAATSGGTMWIYSPPVGGAKYGTVIPISGSPVIAGLAEARDRLRALQARRRAQEPDR
jgi:hypothetical protein